MRMPNMPESIRAVLFDAVGTLLRPDPPVTETYVATGRRFGSTLSAEQVKLRFRAAFERQEHEDRRRGDGRTDESRESRRWETIVGEVFDDVDDREGLFESLWNHFARADSWRLYDDVREPLQELTARGFVIGLASNFDGRLHAIARGHDPLASCQHVFVSSELGYRKPSTRFFAAIQRALGCGASELLHVGDSLEYDYQAARAAGWRALLLDRKCASTATDRVTSLSELARLFGPA